MNINDLKYIVTIADEGSITKASNKLFVAQPSLSLCIKRIEENMRLKIFNRVGNGLALTKDGEFFCAYARRILNEYNALIRLKDDLNNLNGGKLSIGVTESLAPLVIPMVFVKFRDEYPEVDVEFIEDNSLSLENKLISGEIEAAFMHFPIINQSLYSTDFKSDRYVLYMRKSCIHHKKAFKVEGDDNLHINLKYLRNEPFAMTVTGGKTRSFYDSIFNCAGFTPNVVYRTQSMPTLQSLVEADYCSAIIPEHYFWGNEHQSEYLIIETDIPIENDYRYVVAHKEESLLSHATIRFLQLLKDGAFDIK